jgi:hypothetical protein
MQCDGEGGGGASGSARQARVVSSDRHPTNQARRAKRRRGHGTGSAAAPIMAIAPKSISWNAAMRCSAAGSPVLACSGAGACSLSLETLLLASSWTMVRLCTRTLLQNRMRVVNCFLCRLIGESGPLVP